MARRCTICSSPARASIEAELIANEPQLEIAERYSVHQSSLSRHLNDHMDPPASLLSDDEIEPLELTGTLEERLDALVSKAAQILRNAERTASTDTQIRAVAELRKQLELMAKLAGQIAEQTQNIQILQVIVNGEDVSHIEHGRPDRLLPGF